MTRRAKPPSLTSDPLDDVPEFSPIHPKFKVSEIGSIEVHRAVYDSAGHKRWRPVLGDWKPHAGLADIKSVAGGGRLRIHAKRANNSTVFCIERDFDGKPNVSTDEPEENPDDDDDVELDDPSLRLVHETIRQQSAILPTAFTSLTTALVEAGRAHASSMETVAASQQNIVQSHAAALEALRVSYRAEIDGYRLEIARLTARLADYEKKTDDLAGQNAGFLRTIAQGKSVNEWVQAFKDVAPELPKIKAMFAMAQPKQIEATAPSTAAEKLGRMSFGGVAPKG